MDYSGKSREELIDLLKAAEEENTFARLQADTGVEGVLLCSDSVIVKSNNKATAILGYTVEELQGLPLEAVVDPEGVANLKADSLTGNGSCQTCLFKKDGSSLAVHLRTSLAQLPEGLATVYSFIEYEPLGLTEQRFKDIYNITPNAVIQVDPRGRLLATNSAGARFFGYETPDAAVSARFFVGKYLSDPMESMTFFRRLRREERIPSFVFKAKNPHSQRESWVEVSATPFYTASGQIKHYEAILRDVTASKVMEIYLKNEKSRLNAVFNSIPGPVLVIDPSTSMVVDFNESARIHFGDIKGTVHHLGCFTRTEQERENRLIDVGETQMTMSSWQCCDPEGRDWTVYDVPFLNIDGAPLSLKFMLDISKRVEYEQKIKEARALAEQANQAKSDFLANMSHEIRTPLNGVLGTLQLLLDDGLTDTQKRYVDVAVECGKSLLSLINSILNISRVDAGRMDVHLVEMKPEELFSTTTTLCVPQAEKKGIQLTFQPDESLRQTVFGDQERIRQILFNLIGNAIKFTDSGNIVVAAKLLPFIKGNGNRTLYFSVSDTGVGIPPFLIDQAFDVFSQVDSSYAKRHQGAGLGLGIVKRLVKLQNGTIVVDSDGETGTTMHLTVEVKDVSEDALAGTAKQQPVSDDYDLTGLKVLIAEDEMINRTIAIAMLEKIGCEVVSVSDGMKALEVLRNNSFDLIFMDIQMPGCSGIDVTRRLRKDSSYKDKADTPIIAMTAHAMEGDKETFLKTGMDGYVAKPFDLVEVKQAMVEVLVNR